jgi:hypothetical protein
VVASVAALVTTAIPVGAAPPPYPINVAASGANGVGRITTPGRPCAEGGNGSYRHYSLETSVPGGQVSSLPANLRSSLDVHHDGTEPVGTPIAPTANQAFLLGSESHATFTNQRGAIQLRLTSGSGTCQAASLSFDGITVAGTGTWGLDPLSTNGAYRSATGNGTFILSAGVAPGADNPWTLSLQGSINVLQPTLKVEVVSTFWGNLGLDYVTRRVSVTYRITNTGPGDAFNTVLQSTTSPTAGVSPLGPTPQPIGDLLAGQAAVVTVRYQLGLLSPCALVILSCRFDTTVNVAMPDALDVLTPQSATVPAKAPDFPPPL